MYSPPASCVLWYEASAEGYSGGANASVLHDQSGNSNDTSSQVGTVTFTLNAINGLPAFSFPGTAYYYFPKQNLTGNWSVMAVVNLTGDNELICSDGLNGDGFQQGGRYGQSGSNVISSSDGSNNPISSTLGVAQGNWVILEWICSGGTVAFYQNGLSYGSGPLPLAIPFSMLGAVAGLGIINGFVAEILLCNAGLGSTDRTAMESYLNTKYFVAAAKSNPLFAFGGV